jgi:hypothetical protein
MEQFRTTESLAWASVINSYSLLQGFQINLQLVLIENENVESFSIIFYLYNCLHKVDFPITTKKFKPL